MHIALKDGLKNLCGERMSIVIPSSNGYGRHFIVVDAYPRAYEAPEKDHGLLQWEIVFNYGEAKHEAVPMNEDRFCSACWLLRSMMKANGITSRRAVRRLLRQQGGIK